MRRQHKNDDRRAAEMMAEGNFHDALAIYEAKGAIHWTRTQDEARAALVAQWAKDSAAEPDKTRFVFAYTNDDVDQLNARSARRAQGARRARRGSRASRPSTGAPTFAAGDRIQFTGTDKKQGLINGEAGTIADASRATSITVRLDGRDGRDGRVRRQGVSRISGTAMPARSTRARGARSTRPISITPSIGDRPRAMSP